MSENIELEALTRSLNQIVSTLTDLISKSKSPSLIAEEVPRVKKTADMTYHDFLIKALSVRPALEAPTKKQSYRLQEDLELLLDLSAYTVITNKCFEEIVAKKKILRTLDSLKSRYNDYLSKIGEAEMKKIVAWVEKEGVDGYLYFEDNELKISLTDPKD